MIASIHRQACLPARRDAWSGDCWRETHNPQRPVNVRELEGAVVRLAAYASLSNKRIDLDSAQQTLGAAITRPREVITVDGVIKAVASYHGLTRSHSRCGAGTLTGGRRIVG